MTKIWIVTEISFEYNDNYYYSDDDSGIPNNIFQTEDEAREYAEKLEIKALKGCNLSEYGEDFN